eukprot:2647858-Rhodomonas_salina.5
MGSSGFHGCESVARVSLLYTFPAVPVWPNEFCLSVCSHPFTFWGMQCSPASCPLDSMSISSSSSRMSVRHLPWSETSFITSVFMFMTLESECTQASAIVCPKNISRLTGNIKPAVC